MRVEKQRVVIRSVIRSAQAFKHTHLARRSGDLVPHGGPTGRCPRNTTTALSRICSLAFTIQSPGPLDQPDSGSSVSFFSFEPCGLGLAVCFSLGVVREPVGVAKGVVTLTMSVLQ